MNEWDLDNLMFFLGTDEEDFQAWFDQASNDDIDYALNLFLQRRRELINRGLKEHEHYPEVKDFTDAKNVLKKFMIGK